MTHKISIRFFDDSEVRAVWDDERAKWWFSVLDIIGVLRDENDYEKNRNYWKYLKTKLSDEDNQLVSETTQLKLTASDGKNITLMCSITMALLNWQRAFQGKKPISSSSGSPTAQRP